MCEADQEGINSCHGGDQQSLDQHRQAEEYCNRYEAEDTRKRDVLRQWAPQVADKVLWSTMSCGFKSHVGFAGNVWQVTSKLERWHILNTSGHTEITFENIFFSIIISTIITIEYYSVNIGW